MVLMDRGFARNALEGDAVMARTAVRRRRNLHWQISLTILMAKRVESYILGDMAI